MLCLSLYANQKVTSLTIAWIIKMHIQSQRSLCHCEVTSSFVLVWGIYSSAADKQQAFNQHILLLYLSFCTVFDNPLSIVMIVSHIEAWFYITKGEKTVILPLFTVGWSQLLSNPYLKTTILFNNVFNNAHNMSEFEICATVIWMSQTLDHHL